MSVIILDGKTLANEILETQHLVLDSTLRRPKVVVISIGDDIASEIYLRNKRKACEKCDIIFEHISDTTAAAFRSVKRPLPIRSRVSRFSAFSIFSLLFAARAFSNFSVASFSLCDMHKKSRQEHLISRENASSVRIRQNGETQAPVLLSSSDSKTVL